MRRVRYRSVSWYPLATATYNSGSCRETAGRRDCGSWAWGVMSKGLGVIWSSVIGDSHVMMRSGRMEGSDTALPVCVHSYKRTHIYVVRPHNSLVRRGSESRSSSFSAGSGRLLLGATEHSENAAQGSVRVQVSTIICLDRRVQIVLDRRCLTVSMGALTT